MNTQLSPKDWQLLSAYLDGQLSERERSQVERQLSARPGLSQALDELRVNRAVLRRLPTRKVPHNFVLTREMAAQAARPWYLNLVPMLRFSSALAAVFLVVTLFAGSLGPQPSPQTAESDTTTMRAAGAEEAPMAPEAAQPADAGAADLGGATIYWGGPPSAPMATGMGGLGGGGPVPGGMGGGAEVVGKGGGGGYPDMTGSIFGQLPNVFHPPADSRGGKIAMQPPSTVGVPPDSLASPAEQTALNDGPILGLPDANEQGSYAVEPVQPVDLGPTSEPPSPANFTVVQVGLALLAVATGLAAVWLHRRSIS